MCGFLSLFGENISNKQIDKLDESLNLLKHRGPDNQTRKILFNKKCYLGHTRLNIIDKDLNSNQPIFSKNQKYVMVFNGEIFNHLILRNSYLSHINFKTKSDTETLIELWACLGENSIELLEGMFSFAILDKMTGEYYCVRDRFGIKPLYFSIKNENVIVSSEIKPILNYFEEIPKVNNHILSDFLSSGLIDHKSETFFKNINKVQPGHFLKGNIQNPKIEIFKWFDLERIYLENNDRPDIKFEEKLEFLEDTLTKVLKESLISEFDIALNLSNGIDSGLLQILLNKMGNNNSSFLQFYNDNIDAVSNFAPKKLYSSRKSIHIKPELIIDNINKTHFYQEEPYTGLFINGYSEIYSQAKKEGFRVFLDANGLDEFFLGYKKYRNNFPKKLEFHSIDSTYKGIELLSDLFSQEYKIFKDNQLFNNARDLAQNDLLKYKIPRALRFNDKVSMENSIELRVPFLDHRLLSASMIFSEEELLNNNIGKLPLRHILAKYTNHQFAFNKKNHLQSPQTNWLSNELYEFVYELLSNGWLIKNQVISEKKLYKLLKDLKFSIISNSYNIWQLISTEIWIKELISNYGNWK